MGRDVAGMSLVDAIIHAFTSVRPPGLEEIRVLRWLAANPGGSYEQALAAYGKGDLALVIGHLVYDRYGCFRQFLEGHEDQSSVLINKDRSGGSVKYTLKPETIQTFAHLGVLT